MAAEIGPQEETTPATPCYDRREVNQRIFDEAIAFEEKLNLHVEPWITLFTRLVLSRLYGGVAAFVAAVSLGIVIYAVDDQSFWPAFGITVSPLAYAVWTSIFHGLATTCGDGVQGSEGLAYTRSELKAILHSELARLERAQEVGEQGLANYSNRSAVKALADLCTVRMKGLFLHQRALRRINMLNEACETMLQTARILALVYPLVIVLLAAALFAGPFLLSDPAAPWATTDLALIAALLTVAGLVSSFLPFVMVYRFVRGVQHKLADTLRTNWQVNPSDFDSTGPITEQFEWILDQWEECRRSWQHMNSHLKSTHP